MYIPKKIGEYKIDPCPFCGEASMVRNKMGIPVCSKHKTTPFPAVKCMCGGALDLKEGKWGPFFLCFKCGPVSMKKVLEMNDLKK